MFVMYGGILQKIKGSPVANLPASLKELGHLRSGDFGGDLRAGAQPAHRHLGVLAGGWGGSIGGGCGWG